MPRHLIPFVTLLLSTPLAAQVPNLCGGQSCEFFSELGYAFRVDGFGNGLDHSIVFENGLVGYPDPNVGAGASGYFGVDFNGEMRAGLKFRLRRLFGASRRFDFGIGTILFDSRGISPSFVADVGVTVVKPVTIVGGLEVIRLGQANDQAWWTIGARVWREQTEPDAIGGILLGAGFIATIIRNAF